MTAPGFFSIRSAAAFFEVSTKTVRRWIIDGQIKRYVKLERAIRIPAAELERFARSRMIERA